MIELLPVIFLGIAAGLFVGIAPGVGASTMLLICYPFLATLDPGKCIIFYAVLIQASQFGGSVTALSWNQMGELTSGPAIQERKILAPHGVIGQGISVCANSSIIAALFTLVASILIIEHFSQMLWLLRSEIQLSLALIFLAVSAFWTQTDKPNIALNTLLIVAGLAIGTIGFNPMTNVSFLTFENAWLYGGIPFLPLVTGLIIIPLLIKLWKSPWRVSSAADFNFDNNMSIKWASTARGTVVGFFAGLIPYMGTIVSSQISHSIEKRFYPEATVEHSLNRLSSAEAANNSASISVLLPFLIFGIVMQNSEAILYQLLSSSAWTSALFDKTWATYTGLAILIASVISWMATGLWIRVFNRFIIKIVGYISLCTIAFAVGIVIYFGWQEFSALFYIALLLLFTVFGVWLNKVDFTPLIIGFLMEPIITSKTLVVYNLYFNL
jgi:putative tricarboxylic transport membrane protein